jgi:hypothetical protein
MRGNVGVRPDPAGTDVDRFTAFTSTLPGQTVAARQRGGCPPVD